MKTTRKLTIKDRVFSLNDLQRVANIVGAQEAAAREAGADSSASYSIEYADETWIEVDESSVVGDELMARPARAVRVEFEFHDYKNRRSIHFSLRQGNSAWESSTRIAGEDRAWVDANFMAIKEAVETAKPQSTAPRRYQGVILHASALGIGTLGHLALKLLIGTVLVQLGVFDSIQPVGEDSRVRAAIIGLGPVLYGLSWIWRWFLGLIWGAAAVCSWLLDLWPSVEFSFGPEHQHLEAERRRRLAAFGSLVAFPIMIAIAYDLVKYAY